MHTTVDAAVPNAGLVIRSRVSSRNPALSLGHLDYADDAALLTRSLPDGQRYLDAVV